MRFAVRLVLCSVAWLMPVSAAAYWDSIADERAWHLAVRAYALDPARDAEFDPAYQDMATALRIRCLGDDMAACHGLAGYYRQGHIVPGDQKLAISLNWLGCEVEYGPSCLATTMQEVLYEVSWPGLPYFVKGCKQGQAEACCADRRAPRGQAGGVDINGRVLQQLQGIRRGRLRWSWVRGHATKLVFHQHRHAFALCLAANLAHQVQD